MRASQSQFHPSHPDPPLSKSVQILLDSVCTATNHTSHLTSPYLVACFLPIFSGFLRCFPACVCFLFNSSITTPSSGPPCTVPADLQDILSHRPAEFTNINSSFSRYQPACRSLILPQITLPDSPSTLAATHAFACLKKRCHPTFYLRHHVPSPPSHESTTSAIPTARAE